MSSAVLEAPAPVLEVENLGPRPDFEPTYLGPVFRRGPDGNFLLPEHSLGLGCIRWAGKWLRGADGEPGWKFTMEQSRLLMWWYAIDRQGRFIYRSGVIQLIKGAGKDPIAMVIAAIELAGPCRFDYWLMPDGRKGQIWEEGAVPVACRQKNEPWIQFVGVAMEQNKNSTNYMQAIFTDEAKAEFGINVAITKARAPGGALIEAIASSPGTMEGNRPSLVVANEPHHWLKSTGGDDLRKVIRRNVSKMRKQKQARALWITNAYDPNEDSTAQQIREAYEKQLARGIEETLYHSIEAPEDVPVLPDYTYIDENGDRICEYELHEGDLKVMVPPTREVVIEYLSWLLAKLQGDAFWIDPEETAKDILDPESDLSESRRFYTNAIVSGEGSFIADADAMATRHELLVAYRDGIQTGDPLRRGWMLVQPSDEVVLFFDGSKSGDSTALVGCRVSDRYTFLVGLWEKPPGERGAAWLAPRDLIDARVREAMDTFNVVAFWADPSHAKDDAEGVRYWDGLIDQWHLRYGVKFDERLWAVRSAERLSSIMWDMSSPVHQAIFSEAVVRVADEFDSRNLVWDGHPDLRNHLRNARTFMGQHGLILRKAGRGSSKKIDAAVCFVGARMLARIVDNKPEIEPKGPQPGPAWIPPSYRRGRR